MLKSANPSKPGKRFAEILQADLMPIEESHAPCRACGKPYGECIYRFMNCYAPADTSQPKGLEYLKELGIGVET